MGEQPSELDNQKYKPFLPRTKYNTKYRKHIGNVDNDGQMATVDEYSSAVYDREMVEKAQETNNDKTDGTTQGSEGETDKTNREEEELNSAGDGESERTNEVKTDNTDHSFMVTMATNN